MTNTLSGRLQGEDRVDQQLGQMLRAWMGLVPAATIFMPSAMMAADRMVAVVVPSPAVSLVFDAACRKTQKLAWERSCRPA